MELKFKHITSTATFNVKKFSASSGDNTYFTGADPNTQVAGTPDILYKDLVFCKCNGKIYTHGKFYETGDSNGDSYTEYLQTQATKANKHLILSGAEVVESNVAGYYRRADAFVYIKDLGIVSVVPLGSDYQNINPTFQLWRCGRNTIPEREWEYFWTNVQPSSSYPIVEKVCDWSDLARLSDLEVPVATEYQNGLVKVDSELSLSSTNPIANNAITNALNITTFSSEWRTVTQYRQIDYWSPVNSIQIPSGYSIICVRSEIKNEDGTFIQEEVCTSPVFNTYGAYASMVYVANPSLTFKVRLTAYCMKI